MDPVYHSHYAHAPKSNRRTYCPNIDTKASNFAIPSAVSNHGIWTPPQSATADRRPSFDASISGLSSSATLSPQPPSTPHNENIFTDDFVLIRPNDSFSESEGLPNLTSNCILQTPMRQSSMYTQAPHTTDERSYQQYIDHGMPHRLHGQVMSEPRNQMHYDHSQWEQFTPTEVFSTPAPMMPTQAIASVGLTPSLFSDYHQVPSSAAASQSSVWTEMPRLPASDYNSHMGLATPFESSHSLVPSQVLPHEEVVPQSWNSFGFDQSFDTSLDSVDSSFDTIYSSTQHTPVSSTHSRSPTPPRHTHRSHAISAPNTCRPSRRSSTRITKSKSMTKRTRSTHNTPSFMAACGDTMIEFKLEGQGTLHKVKGLPPTARSNKKELCGHIYADGSHCTSSFDRSEHLKRHRESKHEEKKPFTCPLPDCNQSGKRYDNHSDHMKTHLRKRGNGPKARNQYYEWEEFVGYLRKEWDAKDAEKMVEKLEKWRRGEGEKRRSTAAK